MVEPKKNKKELRGTAWRVLMVKKRLINVINGMCRLSYCKVSLGTVRCKGMNWG